MTIAVAVIGRLGLCANVILTWLLKICIESHAKVHLMFLIK